MKDWKLEMDFLSEMEQKLVRECLHNTDLTPTTTTVSELGRFGNSGARLLLCVLSSGMPLVIKIHDKTKIKKEYQAIQNVGQFFPDVWPPVKPALRFRGKAALLYQHKGAASRQEIKDSLELREMVYALNSDTGKFQFEDEDVLRVLDKIWRCCAVARENKNTKKVEFKFKEEYERYMRKEAAHRALASIFGNDRDKELFDFLGVEITNPLFFVNNKCFELPYKGKKGPVHGDLHANNVVIDKFRNVHLIDFAWAASHKHILVDYVLMECSLRFLLFPHDVNPVEQLQADTILLNADGGQQLAEWKTGSPLEGHYRRLGTILHQIRNQAQKFLPDQGNDAFLEYLAAQFLVLFGQMSYKDYNRLIAARALGLIAHKLLDGNFGSRPLDHAEHLN